jgi:hypothetical protein
MYKFPNPDSDGIPKFLEKLLTSSQVLIQVYKVQTTICKQVKIQSLALIAFVSFIPALVSAI